MGRIRTPSHHPSILASRRRACRLRGERLRSRKSLAGRWKKLERTSEEGVASGLGFCETYPKALIAVCRLSRGKSGLKVWAFTMGGP